MKIRPLMLAPPLIFLGFAVFAAIGMFRDDPNALPSARAGQVVPDLTLEALPGKKLFDSDALKTDGIKLVNYWASWCAPCRVEHPHLQTLADEGIPIYGINYKDTPANALGFLEELGDPYRALGADTQGRTGLDWGLYGVPETYLVDGDGVILMRHAGPVTERVLQEKLRPALEAASD